MQGGFEVDLDSMEDARRALARLVAAVDANPVQDLDAPASAYGHDGLGHVTAAFTEAWQKSVDQQLQEIGNVIDGLAETAAHYRELEQKITSTLGRVGE